MIAFYLPQFYPIPENDSWWGPGFTEWTNVARARPLFPSHVQPRLPGELGFYDLRLQETREAQARLAQDHGVEAFCYWHYWFGGKRILERVLDEVIDRASPDLPFLIGWANQSWSGIWHGAPDKILIEQTYPNDEDVRIHFLVMLRAFADSRYACVDGKPILYIYDPASIPNASEYLGRWREMARAEGFPGLFIVGELKGRQQLTSAQIADWGVDGIAPVRLPGRLPASRDPRTWFRRRRMGQRLVRWAGPSVYAYEQVAADLLIEPRSVVPYFPCVLPNWDNTPRSGRQGVVLQGATPEKFRIHLQNAIAAVAHRPESQRLVFIKSWNEWAEGNYLEPDREHGRAWLDVVREEVFDTVHE